MKKVAVEGGYTLGHEIGHVLGAAHNEEWILSKGNKVADLSAAPYGAGSLINDTHKHSIMA